MRFDKMLRMAALAGAMLAAPAAFAQVSLSIVIGTPPPPPQIEVVPVPRPGYVWAPGYWGWNGYSYIWIHGRWILGRPGYRWEPEHWERAGNRWRFVHGDWARERHERYYGH